MIQSHKIKGGGVQLHVVETGNRRGQAILYIHGFSQCRLAWSRQLSSDLAKDYRLVAMDMRGHGLSDKPEQGYDDSKLWADDVNAVIETLDLEAPVLCGWSYGSLVILDHIRHYGANRLGGLHFVGAVTKLGSADAMAVLTPELLALVPDLFSTDVNESVRGLSALLRLAFVQERAVEEQFLMLGYNVCVPPFVRQALFSRTINNDDTLSQIQKPVLITHGDGDRVVKPSAAGVHKAFMAHAEIQMMENAGHAPFWDDAPTFNRRQREFCQTLSH